MSKPTEEQKEDYLFMVEKLNLYNVLYHCDDTPIVSDYFYDELFDKVKNFEDTFGEEFVSPNSPSMYMGCPPKHILNKVRTTNNTRFLGNKGSTHYLKKLKQDDVVIISSMEKPDLNITGVVKTVIRHTNQIRVWLDKWKVYWLFNLETGFDNTNSPTLVIIDVEKKNEKENN